MYLDSTRLRATAARIGSVATVSVQKRGIAPAQMTTPQILAALDGVHQQVRVCTSTLQLASLLDEYVALTALLASGMASGLAAPFIPGGSVLAAAVGGMRGA
jgi:hypothetical protein